MSPRFPHTQLQRWQGDTAAVSTPSLSSVHHDLGPHKVWCGVEKLPGSGWRDTYYRSAVQGKYQDSDCTSSWLDCTHRLVTRLTPRLRQTLFMLYLFIDRASWPVAGPAGCGVRI